ncbi:MAG: glycosyltransferase family 2 protein, partial [Microgenomates group bacterium]
MNDKLAIITVSFNKKAVTQLIESLAHQNHKNFTLYIVDTSGNNDTFPPLNPNVKVLNRINKGYAYGINEGIKEAMTDGVNAFCIINDDTYVEKDFTQKANASIKSHPSSLIGGKIYYAPEHEYHKDRYAKKDQGNVLWYAGGTVDWSHSQPGHRGVDEVDLKQFDKVEETEFITGCLMLLDKSVINSLGFLDESYFLYYEDADYCERAKKLNIKLIYDPSVKIWHLVSQSTDGSGSKLHQKYQKKNLVKFALKYAPLRTKLHVLKNYFFAV